MRRLKNPNQWPPGGWNYEEPATGFRFRGSSLQDLAAKVKLHREVNYLGRENRIEEDIQEQIILKAPEEFDGWEEASVFAQALWCIDLSALDVFDFDDGRSDSELVTTFRNECFFL